MAKTADEFLNDLARAAGQVAVNAGKEALRRAAEGAAEGALSVVDEHLDMASGLVEEGKRRVKRARGKVRR